MTDSSPPPRLADEHAVLQQEVETRARRVLDALASGRWPTQEVPRLLDYLRYELLDQAVNEERLLYPLAPDGFADPRIRQLVEDHVALRDLADRLAAVASAAPEAGDPEKLTGVVLELRQRLGEHLVTEQQVMRPVAKTGVEAVRRPFRSHEWFQFTEGPVVDMDRLPRDHAHSAVMERLVRMRPGERLEITSNRNVQILADLLTRRGMNEVYGWAYLEEGPQRWRAAITRRS